jgi:hypothetical protein
LFFQILCVCVLLFLLGFLGLHDRSSVHCLMYEFITVYCWKLKNSVGVWW